MTDPANLLTEWSRLLIGSLKNAGVRHVVVSPGSRNTSLTLAALTFPELSVHSVLDERSAGFFGLGLSRATAMPVVLLCTSGTALAHYLPALIEASLSGHPLIVLSADRPGAVQEALAPQTIQQRDLFGVYVKRCFDLGNAGAEQAELLGLKRKAAQSVHLALSGHPGPVHLNFPAQKPLESRTAETHDEQDLTSRVDALLLGGAPTVKKARLVPEADAYAALEKSLREVPETLLSIGPLSTTLTRQVSELGARLGLYVFCELPGFSTPVESLSRGLSAGGKATLPEPRAILHVGPPPISSAWHLALERTKAEVTILAGGDYPDPSGTAHRVILGDLETQLTHLDSCDLSPTEPALRQRFTRTYERASEACLEAIERETALSEYRSRSIPPGRPAPLAEPAVFARLLSAVGKDTQLCLGNSLTVRVATWVAPLGDGQKTNQAPRDVFLQRGASGIDGLIAGAAGVARASRRPTLLILGDVSAAHDLSSLAVARTVRTPLAVVVIDNGGGHIFDHLPLYQEMGEHPDFQLWTTPPRLDFKAAAKTYGVNFAAPPDIDSIAPAVATALTRPGATLLVIRTHPSSSREFMRTLSSGGAHPGSELN